MKTECPGKEWAARSGGRFYTTRWNMVLAAGKGTTEESQQSLEDLCRTYWYPLYAFARHQGCSQPDAEDRVQEFFARLLAKGYVARADPARGKFRSFLLSAFRHYLANDWERQTAAKRGGRTPLLSWDELRPEIRYAAEAGNRMSPERIYERTWALSVLGQVRKRLKQQACEQGRLERFELLEQFLPGATGGLSYGQLAKSWGVKEVTVRIEVHHLRRRYAVLLRETVADLVANPEEAGDELRALIDAVST